MNRKILILNSLIVFVLIFGIYWNISHNKIKIKEEDKKEFVKKINSNHDSDGDGLADWEEELYKTNPHKKDSDGDGVNDKDEIGMGRNPLVFGNGDKKDNLKIVQIKENLIDVEGQKKEIEAYKEKLRELEAQRFREYMKIYGKKTSKEDEEWKRREGEQKIKWKKDLNKIADVLMLKSAYSESMQLALKNVLDNKIKKKEVSQKDLEGLKKVADLYSMISNELGKIEVHDDELDSLRNSLFLAHNKVSESLNNIYENKDFDSNLKIYAKSVADIVQTRKLLYLFIRDNKIKLESYDSASFLEYKL